MSAIGTYTTCLFLLLYASTSFGCLPCPIFTRPSYSASIAENATIGTIALSVLAFNAYSDPISYGTSYLGLNLPFEIDSSTGDISVISQLNYNVKNSYEIIVRANVYGYTKSVIATINILDSPDPPQPIVCTPSELILTVYENTLSPYNSTVWLNCSRSSGEPFLYNTQSSLISIDGFGFVIIEKELDYENQSMLDTMVTFTELDSTLASGYANITIIILPINEYTPHFTTNNNDTIIFRLSEATGIGTYIGQLTAHDEDTGSDGQLTFTINTNESNGSNYFTVTPTGQLYTVQHFDYEDKSIFKLIVTVSDNPWNTSAPPLTSTALVLLQITDENDNQPSFTQNVYYAQVMENASIGDYVLTIKCYDADSSINGITVYSIVQQPIGNHFVLNSSTGDISIQNELDYESVTSHQFTVSCIDYNSTANTEPTSTALVVLDVQSINEYSCTFNQTEYIFNVFEDTLIGATIGRLYAFDDDKGLAGELFYQLMSCFNTIQVNEHTGEVSLITTLDYEEEQNFTCTVQVTDGQQPKTTDYANIIVLISNINDNPPDCTQLISSTPIEVYENATVGTSLFSLSCNDRDDDTLTFTTNSHNVVITQHEGDAMLLVLNVPFNTTGPLQINIDVKDGYYTLTVPVMFFIVSLPSFTTTDYNCTVYEDIEIGTMICQVFSLTQATHFTLNSQDTFTVLSQTGEIVLLEQLDYETTSNYSLIVYSHKGTLSDSATVNILVQDSNDNTPIMPEYIFISIKENTPQGKAITDIECTDIDSQYNGLVTMNVSSILQISQNDTTASSVSDSLFYIDDTALVVNGNVDFETSKSFRLIIECFDEGIPSLTSTSVVVINIEEENEYSPVFTSPPPHEAPLSLSLSFDNQIGSILYNFKAQDKDSGLSGQIQYSLIRSNESFEEYSKFLRVDRITGELMMVLPVSCTYGNELEYYLIATDRGNPSLSTNASFNVYITDCHCHTSPLPDPTNVYYIEVPEDSNDTILTTVHCISDTTSLLYTLSSSPFFHIDNSTGIITRSSPLDYETQSSHQLLVHCYCSPVLYTEVAVYISVQPVNDNPPFFEPSANYTIELREDTHPGTILTTIRAHDRDRGSDGKLNYFIHNFTEHFEINKPTGDLYLIEYLDREEQDYYTLTIVATDNPINSSHSKSAYLDIHVHVLDVNDNSPQCTENVYRANITSFTIPVGTIITQLTCHDKDSKENGILRYFIANQSSSLFGINSTSGQVYLSQLITTEVSLFHTIPITVQDNGMTPLHTTVYLSVELVPTGTTITEREGTSTKINQEGSRNLVAIVIDNLNINEWDNEREALFKTAVANSTSTHCNLYPSDCSLLPMCINRTSDSTYCKEYLQFTSSNIIIHQSPVMTTNTSSSPTTNIQISVYVLLPQTAVKAPYRQTDYVVPKETLEIIIQNNKNTINAIMRDSVSQRQPIIQWSAWKELALSLLAIFIALISVVCIAVTITYTHKNYKRRKTQAKVFILKPERHSSLVITNNNHFPLKPSSPSSSSTGTSHDSCSLINVSEVGGSSTGSDSTTTSGRTSQTGMTPPDHQTNDLTIIQRLNSMRTQDDAHDNVEFHHPFANETEIT